MFAFAISRWYNRVFEDATLFTERKLIAKV